MVKYILNLIYIKDDFDLYDEEEQNNFIKLVAFIENSGSLELIKKRIIDSR